MAFSVTGSARQEEGFSGEFHTGSNVLQLNTLCSSVGVTLLCCRYPELEADVPKAVESADFGATHTNRVTRWMNRNLQPMAEPSCAKKLKNTGVIAIVVSGLTLFGALNLLSIPAMGGMGHFDHDIFAPVLLCMAVWGLATGIGLLRAWRWSRISMLVFGSVLTAPCVLMAVPFLVMPGYGVVWWEVLGRRFLGLLFLLVPAAIMVRWHIYFRRDDVRTYFRGPLEPR